MIDEVLGVIDAGEPLALDAEIFRALGSVGEHECVEAQLQELLDGEGPSRPTGTWPSSDAGIAEDLVELAPQAAFILYLSRKMPYSAGLPA
jgi:hypothetical protein